MKTNSIIAMLTMALLVAVAPASAQSRKDKRAAQKQQWEMEQQQAREEAELQHQLRMDSIANAKKAADEKAQAEAQRKAEKAAKEAAEKDEIESLKRQLTLDSLKRARQEQARRRTIEKLPCAEYAPSKTGTLHGFATGESIKLEMAKRRARAAALQDLTQKIETSVRTLTHDSNESFEVNLTEEEQEVFKNLSVQVVNQTTGYRTLCEEYETYYNTQKQLVYRCYTAIEIGEDEITKGLYQGLPKEKKNEALANYETFKREFEKVFNDQPLDGGIAE